MNWSWSLQNALTAVGVPYESMIVEGVSHSPGALRNALLSDRDPFFRFMANQLGVPVPVPEPSTRMLAPAGGLALLLGVRRRTCAR